MINIDETINISYSTEGMTPEQIEKKNQGIERRWKKVKECIGNLQNYEVIANWNDVEEHKTFLGDKTNRICRFCGTKEGEKYKGTSTVCTFKKEAHALSNLIGNTHLFSHYECDRCNGELFCKEESNFSNYMNLYHCVFQIKGKRGVPSYKLHPDDFSRIDAKDGIKIKAKEDEESIIEIKESENAVVLKGKRSYIPQMVYKCILKMALAVMPKSEMVYFEDALDFLQGNIKCDKNLVVRMKIYRESFSHISYMIYKRKANCTADVPSYLFLLCYNNIAFQMYLPFCKTDKYLDGKQVTIPTIPLPYDIENGPIVSKILDLSSDTKVIKEPYSINVKYERMEKTDFEHREE